MPKTKRGAEPPSQDEARSHSTGLPALRGDNLVPKDVDWLWYPYIPRGMLTALSGDPEAGKSWITASLTACLTSGAPFPMQTSRREPENVIMLNSEDAVEETQVPRLIGLGADMRRVFLTEKGFGINKQSFPALREFVMVTNASLLTIDPIQSFMGTGYDMNKATDVRSWTDLLTNLAKETGLSVVIVGHKRKSKKADGDDNPLYQGLGSIDFVGASRSVLHARVDEAGGRVLEHIKASVGHKGDPLAYEVARREDKTSPFRWLGPYTGGSYKRLEGTMPLYELACKWLIDILADGPRTADDVTALAAKLDPAIGEHTLRKAKQSVCDSIRRGKTWWWVLKPSLAKAVEAEREAKDGQDSATGLGESSESLLDDRAGEDDGRDFHRRRPDTADDGGVSDLDDHRDGADARG